MNLLYLLALLSVVHAQYFSEGWKPGQAATTPAAAAPAAEFTPGVDTQQQEQAAPPTGSFIDRLLTSGPFPGLFEKLGVNITQKMESAAATQLWDERIPLITDDNYGDMIVNETLSEEEEKNRVWFLVITISSAKQDGISKFADECFDKAYDIAQSKKELSNVRWGRIDYLNVTAITTKWSVWSAPYIVVLTDRGQSLRFYRASQLRLKPEFMLSFLEGEVWRQTQPWKSIYAPGGDREWVMEYFAMVLTKLYNFFVRVPKWILMAASGGAASLAINLMHRSSKNAAKAEPSAGKKAQKVQGSDYTPAQTATATGASTSTASPAKSPAKSRKNKGRK